MIQPNQGNVILTFNCDDCADYVDSKMTLAEWTAWKTGEPIQNVVPHLTSDEREAIMLNLCISCVKDLYDE